MISRLSLIILLTAAFSVSSIQAAQPPTRESVPEVRLLVDISGSMKQNDPQNLRRPALNLVARLLPDGYRGAIWTFGRMVNPLVPAGPVDEHWRSLVSSQVDQIRSVALFTNIGGVLEAASADLKAGASGEGIHFILLTDGMVDISEDPAVNAKERARILTQVIAPIRRSGARLHTIALSQNADTSLMRSLALETGGLFSVAESSEALSRIFLQALDQAVPSEQVPLENNLFTIDESVREFTALAFLKADGPPVQLVDPNGQSYRQDTHPEFVNWYKDQGYELITVTKPVPGDWRLEAEVQPGSRVTLVTDLRMQVSPLPPNFFPGDLLELAAAFYEGEQLITAPDFLGLIDVDVTISNQADLSGTKRISAAGQPPADGYYRDVIRRLPEMGRYAVRVTADGKTYRRQHTQLVQLNSPIDVELEGQGYGYRLVVIQRSPRIVGDRSQVMVTVDGPDGSRVIRPLPYDRESRRWAVDLEPFGGNGRYEAQLSVEGVVDGGQAFEFKPAPVALEYPRALERLGEYRSILNEEDVGQLVEEVAEAIAPTEPEVLPTIPDPLVQSAQSPIAAPAEDEVDLLSNEDAEAGTEMGQAQILIWSAAGLGILLLISGLGLWIYSRRTANSEDDVAVPAKEEKAASKTELDTQPQSKEQLEPVVATPIEPEPALHTSWPEEQVASGKEMEMYGAVDESQVEDAEEEAVDGRTPEEIADAILAENQLMASVKEEEYGMEDLDLSEIDALSAPAPEEENKR